MHLLAVLVQLVLYACSSSVVLCRIIPSFHFLLQYGKALSDNTSPSPLLLRPFTATVPKTWFTHFYIFGALCSAYALIILGLAHSNIYTTPVNYLLTLDHYLSRRLGRFSTNDFNLLYSQAQLSLAIITIQCARRWYECLYVEKMSNKARIRLGHYLVGHLFYLAVSCAILCDSLQNSINPSPNALSLSSCSVAFVLYLTAARAQYSAHKQLASLKKYSPPPPTFLFKYLVCPHYTAEIVVYISIAVICDFSSATVAVIIWTIVNLGASAEQSRAFYVDKFGEKVVDGKYNIIPFVF
ncbi:uncharacterized protein V2V93DRAFT_391157 [Kockiozyma suomiensis]|uniref:uncharacterized protein n=1 Tax=Kockiozyma suomiensis TaxID=1337062 RepID=UPI003342E83A